MLSAHVFDTIISWRIVRIVRMLRCHLVLLYQLLGTAAMASALQSQGGARRRLLRQVVVVAWQRALASEQGRESGVAWATEY